MKKIMILGASLLQIPAILQAKKMGLFIIVADKNENAAGARLGDVFLNISTLDKERILEASRLYQIDAIFTMATDLPMRTVAYVGEKLGLNTISYETSLNATDKYRMRNILKKANVGVPFYKILNSVEELISFKNEHFGDYILKPTDSSGSRGVTSITFPCSDSDIQKYFNYSSEYSQTSKILVEELMVGPEISVESITFDGITEIVAVTDKITTGKPFFVETGHNIPSKYSKELISDIVKRSIVALGIYNSATHTEIIITKDGPKIVEIGSRLGGDYITSHLVPLATGYNIVEAALNISLGVPPKKIFNINNSSAIRFIMGIPGTIKDIYFNSINKAIKEVYFSKKIGEHIDFSHNSSERIGHIICQASDDSAATICDQEFKNIRLEVL